MPRCPRHTALYVDGLSLRGSSQRDCLPRTDSLPPKQQRTPPAVVKQYIDSPCILQWYSANWYTAPVCLGALGILSSSTRWHYYHWDTGSVYVLLDHCCGIALLLGSVTSVWHGMVYRSRYTMPCSPEVTTLLLFHGRAASQY